MTPSHPRGALRLGERLNAYWLRLYPPAHRRAYGPLMLRAFQDSYRDARSASGQVGVHFWLAVISDEAMSLAREYGDVLHEFWQGRRRRSVVITSGMLMSGGVFAYVIACVLERGESFTLIARRDDATCHA